MSEKETITGVLDGITEKPSGWTEIQVKVDGWQYPVKMATKLEPLIELARAAGTETMEWTFKKQVSEQINPNSGKPFVNRYFEGVSPVGTTQVPQNANGSPTSAPTVDWDAKELRDYRSRAWAQTISAMTHTIKVDESAADIFVRLYALQRKIYRDIVRDLDPKAFEDDDLPFA